MKPPQQPLYRAVFKNLRPQFYKLNIPLLGRFEILITQEKGRFRASYQRGGPISGMHFNLTFGNPSPDCPNVRGPGRGLDRPERGPGRAGGEGMTPVSLSDLKQLLGVINELDQILFGTLECVICHNPIERRDFENGKVLAMTGPKRATAAHAAHFYDETTQQQTPEYERNVKRLAFTYAVQNDLLLKNGGVQ